MRATRSLLPLLLMLSAVGACSRDPAPAEPAADPAADAAGAGRDVAHAEPDAAGVAKADGTDDAAASAPALADLVHADDTLASAQARLGAAVVVPEHLVGAEAETVSGWTLYPGDPTRTLSVYLDETGEHPLMLLAGQTATAWTRADGVRIGLSSQELAQLNGGPYAFMGFDWDYGGVVTDWLGGHLAPDGASAGPVTLCPPAAAEEGGEPPDYPVGDSEFRSDDARLLTNPATVCEFGVNIDPPAVPAPTAAPAGG